MVSVRKDYEHYNQAKDWVLVFSQTRIKTEDQMDGLYQCDQANVDDDGNTFYSILYKLEKYRNRDGYFRFLMQTISTSDEIRYIEWVQSTNPTREYLIKGFTVIQSNLESNTFFGGLARDESLSNFIINIVSGYPTLCNNDEFKDLEDNTAKKVNLLVYSDGGSTDCWTKEHNFRCTFPFIHNGLTYRGCGTFSGVKKCAIVTDTGYSNTTLRECDPSCHRLETEGVNQTLEMRNPLEEYWAPYGLESWYYHHSFKTMPYQEAERYCTLLNGELADFRTEIVYNGFLSRTNHINRRTNEYFYWTGLQFRNNDTVWQDGSPFVQESFMDVEIDTGLTMFPLAVKSVGDNKLEIEETSLNQHYRTACIRNMYSKQIKFNNSLEDTDPAWTLIFRHNSTADGFFDNFDDALKFGNEDSGDKFSNLMQAPYLCYRKSYRYKLKYSLEGKEEYFITWHQNSSVIEGYHPQGYGLINSNYHIIYLSQFKGLYRIHNWNSKCLIYSPFRFDSSIMGLYNIGCIGSPMENSTYMNGVYKNHAVDYVELYTYYDDEQDCYAGKEYKYVTTSQIIPQSNP